jgi:hypothetical protein
MHNLKRNMMLWAVVVPICAAPSFVFAMNKYSVIGMFFGIFVVWCGYVVASSSGVFERICSANPRFRTALKITFGIKLFMVPSSGLGIAFAAVPDMLAGIFSTAFVEMVVGKLSATQLVPTFCTVLIEAFIMSIGLLLVALLLWGAMVLFNKLFGDKHDA